MISLVWVCAAAVLLQDGLRPIPERGRDEGPMTRSFEVRPHDMRRADGFGLLFETPDGRFARVQGALHAVFPRSVYVDGQATVPPGTVFYIGLPPWAQSSAPEPADARGLRLDRRLDRRLSGAASVAPRGRMTTPAVPAGTIWSDRRPARVRALLLRALEAER